MRVAALVATLGLAAIPLHAGVQTRVADGRVRIEAKAVPLSDVLDDLARKTGMKVAYEGAPPRVLVTATLDRDSVAEALLAIFEGLGLTYVIQLDASGTGVAKLLMMASGSRVGVPAAGPFPGRTGGAALPVVPPDEVPPDEPDATPEVSDPTMVERDRVVIDPRTGEPYPPPPDNPPENPPQPPAAVQVQGYPTPFPPGGTPMPMNPFLRSPQSAGNPGPQPQPTPAAP